MLGQSREIASHITVMDEDEVASADVMLGAIRPGEIGTQKILVPFV